MSLEQLDSPALDLRQAVEGLYQVFAAYDLPKNTNPCSCCHSEADEQLLKSRPLRELGAAELTGYAFDALLTWGDTPLFKHFMPRLYELMVFPGEAPLYVGPQILLSKLHHGRWQEWPVAEQRTVQNFLHALWSQKLGETVYEEDWDEASETWLCGIAQAEEILAPYLDQWAVDPRLSVAETLSAFILRSAITRSGGTGRDAFWEKHDLQYEELRRWIYSENAKAILRRAFENGSYESRSEFEAALAMLTA